ncbi:hypothetical protein T05_10241 [Trichinella murrelli]|uniref:Uncharacterized protein n=1 Tax=Trichinella murrelli TaxID=144512 RepID=A0A0V0TT99_9BILA|nr:hypothetical protein T05_10241 [Trichinella murrelli]
MAANEQFICSDKQLLSRVFVSYLNSLVLLDPSAYGSPNLRRAIRQPVWLRSRLVKYPHRLRAHGKPFLYPVRTKTTEVD